jgi:Recombinase
MSPRLREQGRAHCAAVQRARQASRAEREGHALASWRHRLHMIRRARKMLPLVSELYAQLGTQRATARELNKRHLVGLYGKRWTHQQVRQVLERADGNKHA